MKFLAGLLVLLAVSSQVEALCGDYTAAGCGGCVVESGCSWDFEDAACETSVSGGEGPETVWATNAAECASRSACTDKGATCGECVGHNWDTADATKLCQFDLETGECQKGFGVGTLSSDIIIMKAENCGLQSCKSQTDCASCTDNNLKKAGETEDNFCQWDPAGEGLCDTDGKTDIGPRISHGENCAADNEDCDTYTDCASCTIDIGTNGCQWDVNDNECQTKVVGSGTAKTPDECSLKNQDCNLYTDCESCVSDIGITGCEWDTNDKACGTRVPGSSGAKNAEECSAMDIACGDYTDCESCVTDLGTIGCQWDLEDKACGTKIPLSSAAKDKEGCNSSSVLTAGFAIVAAAAMLL